MARRGVRARARGVHARTLAATLAAAACLFAAACGAGARQDAGEPQGTYRMRVLQASFPAIQSIARPTRMVLTVRNLGLRTVPNVAVSIDSFSYIERERYAELAANKRPVWVVETGPGGIPRRPVESQAISPPGGGQTAYVSTWALGPLAPGQLQTFAWLVVPVKPGLHAVRYTVAAGLSGKAKASAVANAGAVLLGSPGSVVPVQGRFLVHISGAPPPRHVDPNTGRVVPGAYPRTP